MMMRQVTFWTLAVRDAAGKRWIVLLPGRRATFFYP